MKTRSGHASKSACPFMSTMWARATTWWLIALSSTKIEIGWRRRYPPFAGRALHVNAEGGILSRERASSAAEFEHAPDWQFRAGTQRLGQNDFGLEIAQCVECFLQSIHFHEPAFGAGAMFRRAGDKIFARNFATQAVKHSCLGHDDDISRR